jgi:hypothetical protein
MAKLEGTQLSLIAEVEDDDCPISDWGYEKLGTKEISVPNLPPPKLGTKEILVPNFYEPPRQIPRWDDPIDLNWKPPIGCLDRKWSKNHRYWCWRYYDKFGKKRSIHLHKDYNKAIRKAMKIGVPTDAKLPNPSASDPQTTAQNSPTDNLIDIAPTAHPAPRSRRAA